MDISKRTQGKALISLIEPQRHPAYCWSVNSATSATPTDSIGCSPSDVLQQFEQAGEVVFLIDLIECYLTDSAEKLRSMRSSAIAHDLVALAHQSHSLRGSSANMGIAGIANMCKELELSANRAADIDYTAAIGRMEVTMTAVRRTLTGYLSFLRTRGLTPV